jgi:hypothetical protein
VNDRSDTPRNARVDIRSSGDWVKQRGSAIHKSTSVLREGFAF